MKWLCLPVVIRWIWILNVKQSSATDDPGWQRPVLVEQPVNTVVARGQPMTLNCRAVGRPPPRIVWLQDGVPVTGARPDRLTLPPGGLFFLSAKERDAGVYQCRAENSAGVAHSRNATLTVAMLRDDFLVEPADTRVTQGGTALLQCDPPRGHPEVKVTWMKDGRSLDIGGRVHQRGGTLYIMGSRPADSGRYVCHAENVLGARRSRTAELTVLVQPYFVRTPESAGGLVGGSLVLSCPVSGVPRPRVHWRRLDAPLPVGRLHYTEENSMRIDGLRQSDAGLYICEAENGVGRIAANVTVDIQEAPTIDMPAEAVVTVGGQMAVQCHVRGQPTPRAIWWRETEFEPLLADEERGRLSTSVQHELYIAPVTPDDLGWWVCGATNTAGSVTGRVLLSDSDRPPRRRTPPPAVIRDDLDRDLVHLAELQVVRPDSVRLTWKISSSSPVDGFYICLISSPVSDTDHSRTGASGRAVRGAPVLDGRPGPVLQRVPVLNGGADSYVLTRLRAGTGYEIFLVPFRAGLEGRLSNLQRVQLPEAAPSAAPGDLVVSIEEDSTIISWSPLEDHDANGLVRGYSLLVLSSDHPSDRPRQHLLNTTSPPLRLPGRASHLRVRIAAYTAAGVGPYSAWVAPVQGWPTDAPPPATEAVPLGGRPGGRSAPPAALVAALGALCLAALGAALLTLHCRRLRAKQERLDTAAALYADVKLPVISREPRSDVLTRNTLWLRDELFLQGLSTAPGLDTDQLRRDELKRMSQGGREEAMGKLQDEERGSEKVERCHIYVNDLPSASGCVPREVRSMRRVSPRGGGSMEVMTPSQVMTSGLESETESELERLTRRVRSLRPRASRSLSSDVTSVPSMPSRTSRPSLRLRHDRRARAPHLPQLRAGAYLECCCYECDTAPMPQDTSCESSSSDFSTLAGLMPRSAPARGPHFHPPHPPPPVGGLGTHNFPASSGDGVTRAAPGVSLHPNDVISPSDSGSSVYAETELNDAPRPSGDSDVSSEAASHVTAGSERCQHKLSLIKSRLHRPSSTDANSPGAPQPVTHVPDEIAENCELKESPVDGSQSEPHRLGSSEAVGQLLS